MPTIKVIDFTGNVIEIKTVAPGRNVAEVLMETWPDGFEGMTPFVYDGVGVEVDEERAVAEVFGADEEWTVQLIPQAEVAISTWILMALSAATLVLFQPKIPSVQNNAYEWDDSDRPQFISGQQNRVQPGRRIPDAFGRIRTYPDLISTPAIEYEGNQQTIRELYVISRGKFVSDAEYFFDETIERMVNADITYYYPGQTWPVDFPIMRGNPSVGTIELPAPNETLTTGQDMVFSGSTVFVDADDFWTDFEGQLGGLFRTEGVVAANKGPKRVLGISTDGKTLTVDPPWGATETVLAGNVNFVGLSYFYPDSVTPEIIDITNWTFIDFGYEFQGVPQGIWEADRQVNSSTPSPFSLLYANQDLIIGATKRDITNSITAGVNNGKPPNGEVYVIKQTGQEGGFDTAQPGLSYASSIYGVPGDAVTEIWVDFEFPTGLYKQGAGNPPKTRQVDIQVFWRKLAAVGSSDPPGAWQDITYSFSDKTRTPRRFTRKIIVSEAGRYEVYCARLTDYVPDGSSSVTVDSVQWIGLAGRQQATSLETDILNCTIADVKLNSQSLRVNGNSRRFNVIGQRELYDYRNEVWTKTSRMSDAIMHTLIDMGNVPRANIDEASLYAIQDDLDAVGPWDGEFSAVVDQTMTIEDQVQLIAGLSHTMVYRRGATFYFRRLKAGLTPATLINARNKIAPETRNFSFSQANEPDAIALRYQDRNLLYKEGSYQYPEGGQPENVEEQSVLGVCDPDAIARMARYLWDKRRYEKDTITIPMMEEGAMLAPGDVITVTDFLREDAPVEGEIIAANGDTYTFDEVLPAGTWALRVRDDLGDLLFSGTVTLPTSDEIQNIPELQQVSMPPLGSSTGLLYSLEEIQTNNRDEYYVVRVSPTREGETTVEGMLYRDETFDADNQAAGATVASSKRIERHNSTNLNSGGVPTRSGMPYGG